MKLSSGLRLGPYEVVDRIGAGGMGEVYRARDSRIGRLVAIKVISAPLGADEKQLRRFEQEARAIGMLSHPSILALYDVGTHEGTPYVVSELLEGETLAARLASSALPQRKVIEMAISVAHGLAAAHEKGIVHRDLKPENIFLTTGGHAKILDFGLAKLTHPVSGGSQNREAMLAPLTQDGMVVGTVGYMSPEQVRGRIVDQRSDLFSFGAIIFECLAGRRAFEAGSAVETMNSILTHEPILPSEVEAAVSPALTRVVFHCLEKNPEERFQSARDLAFQLEALSYSSTPTISRSKLPERKTYSKKAFLAVGAALVLGALAGALGDRARLRSGAASSRPLSTPPQVTRLTFRRGLVRSARFSPDGQSVVYGASWDGEPTRIFSVRPGTPESRALDVGNAEILDVSPQGELAVLLGGAEKRFTPRGDDRVLASVALGGGAPRDLMRGVNWAAWSPDGEHLAIVKEEAGKQRLEFPAGTVLYETAGWITHPRVSTDGSLVAFLDHPVRGDDRGDVTLVDRTGKRRVLTSGWTSVRGLAFSAHGDEVWYTAATTGAARALHATSLGSGQTRALVRMAGQLLLHDVARDGRALVTHDSYLASLNVLRPGAAREVDLAWLDSSGVNDLSNDGGTLLFTEQGDGGGAGYSVYLRRMDGPAIRLGEGQGLALSPDLRSVLALRFAGPDLVILPTGVGERRVLPHGPIREIHWGDFTPDGQRIVFLGTQAGKGARLYIQAISGGEPQPLAPEGVTTTGHPFTPDGKKIAVRSAAGDLVLMPIEGGEPQPIPGAGSGDLPVRFSANGRDLFLCRGNDVPLRVERLELASGKRALWRLLSPADVAGIQTVGPVRLSGDGTGYAYNAAQFLSSLYVLDGVR